MRILISNDDGIKSNGMITFAKELALENEVLVVAPDGNRSSCGHSISPFKKIKLNKIDEYPFRAYSLSGTPVDCIKFAKLQLTDFKPDIIVSGINKGHNIGTDTNYSGTLAIACEGAFFDCISFAFSAFELGESDFELLSKYAVKILNDLLKISKVGDVWNINFPPNINDIKGVKFTPLGKQMYSDRYEKVGEDEYMLVGELIECDNDENCDVEWQKKGYITITPILYDRTDKNKLKSVEKLCIEL